MAVFKLGLALGGGGAAGLAHLGVLHILEREGATPAVIVGSSIGAIVGAMYALQPNVDRLLAEVEELFAANVIGEHWRDAVPRDGEDEHRFYDGLLHFVQKQLVGMRVFTASALRPALELQEPLDHIFGDRAFADLKIPFGAVTLDIVGGREILLTEGRLADALYASAAIPGIFPPKQIVDRLLVDGAFVSSCPVIQTRRLGADYVVAVRIPLAEIGRRRYATGIDVLARTDEIVRAKLTDLETKAADLLITPQTRTIHWADFDRREEAVAAGLEAAEARLKDIGRLAKRSRGGLWWRLFPRR
jgi:NTE family protein